MPSTVVWCTAAYVGYQLGRYLIRRASSMFRLELSEASDGIWCDACLLPSMARTDFLLLSPYGVFTVASTTQCEECGRHQGVTTPEPSGEAYDCND